MVVCSNILFFVNINNLDKEYKAITIKNTIIMDVHKKQNFIVFVYTNTQWVKLIQLAKVTFLTPTLLIGTLPGNTSKAG